MAKVKVRIPRDIDANEIYARKGEKIYCASGEHCLATLSRDVTIGDTLDLEKDFTDIIDGLKTGDVCCPECGSNIEEWGCCYFEVKDEPETS